jgi:hypothetical protein
MREGFKMRRNCEAGKITRLTVLTLLALVAAALLAVPAGAAHRVAVTVETLTADGGFIAEPALWTLTGSARASNTIADFLTSKNVEFDYDGVLASPSFYISYISGFEGVGRGGWMVTVNNGFIKSSAADVTLKNGDVMRWQFTKNFGVDVGAGNVWDWPLEGTTPFRSKNSDKDALIWKIAEINDAGNKSVYGGAYTTAMSALKKTGATQTEVNAALAGLNAATPGGTAPGGGADTGTTPGGGGSNNGTDNGTGGDGSNGGTDNGNNGGSSNNGTDSGNNGGDSNSGTDNGTSGGSNGGTDNGTSGGTSAKVEAEIRDKPAVTPPLQIEPGAAPKNVTASDMEKLGFGAIAETAGGVLTVSREAFMEALEESGIKVDAGKPVAPLPVFRAGVSPGGTVLVTLRATLDGYAGEALRSVAVFKMTYKGTAARLQRADSPGGLAHGRFVWTDAAGNAIDPVAAVTAGTDYYISVAVRDDSEFDLDGWTRGSIVDPLALAVEEGAASGSEDTSQGGGGNGWNSSSGGSGGGGGCDAGALGLFALASLGLTAALRRRGG